VAAGANAIFEDREQNGPYASIWDALWAEGLRAEGGAEGKAAMHHYVETLQRQAEKKKDRDRKKTARVQKKKSKRRS
jgi:hypothetical protein